MNSNPLGPTDHELYVDHMESKAKGRITEAALLIANVEGAPDSIVGWIHHQRWEIAVNHSTGSIVTSFDGSKDLARLPFGHIAVWDGTKLAGIFSANEGYLNNADEFIAEMKELLEKEAV